MKANQRLVEGIAVIELGGRMTGLDSPGRLKQEVMSALAAGQKNIVLNLSQVSFVDSSFIGELVSSTLAVTRVGGSLKLACAVRRVQELLFITRLGSVIDSYESEQGAIASFFKPAH
jgi:anti-sigma B factor antagonist